MRPELCRGSPGRELPCLVHDHAALCFVALSYTPCELLHAGLAWRSESSSLWGSDLPP